MVQMTVYDVLSVINDPIYQQINELEQNHYCRIGELTVTFNKQGLYEVESDQIHEVFRSKETCYHAVCLNGLLN